MQDDPLGVAIVKIFAFRCKIYRNIQVCVLKETYTSFAVFINRHKMLPFTLRKSTEGNSANTSCT